MPIEKACENCGQPFFSYPSDNRRFCSLDCRSARRFGKPDIAPGRKVVHFTCKQCSKPFGMMQAYLTEYLKKHQRGPLYCSRACSNLGRAADTEIRGTFACENCGKETPKRRKPGGRIYDQQKYCSPGCRHDAIKKRALTKFQSGNFGRHLKRNGYVWITVPALANDGIKKTEMLEHRYVMEQHLGRKLHKDETVHHRDGNRQHNLIDNLELFSSRHGPGQRVIDKVQFAIDMLLLYPEFARAAGYVLQPIAHITDDYSRENPKAISSPDP